MAYTKVATVIKTVGQLKGVLTEFNNKDKIYLSGLEGFSVAVSDDGKIIFDSDYAIDEICDPDGLPFK